MCQHYQGDVQGPVYPAPTAVHGRCYFFFDKHHTPANTDDAQWLPGIPPRDEFDVFDLADRHDLSCPAGNLYGLWIRDGSVRILGIRDEQVAMFPSAAANMPWHGFPHWPLAKGRGKNGRQYPAPKVALRKMEAARLITTHQRRRLEAGKHI